MSSLLRKYQSVIPEEVIENVLQEFETINSWEEWKRFRRSSESIQNAPSSGGLPFDPRFNAVHWAHDVAGLCRQIIYGYCWMNSYAIFYKNNVEIGSRPAHTNFHVTYYADNCVTRIDSCRDKIALMVWAYFSSFNPENKREVLDYQQVRARLRAPVKFGLTLKKAESFLKYLEMLHGNEFKRLENYRHPKVHRREPRIEIYGVRPHHDWPYMIPLVEPSEIERFKEKLIEMYPDQRLRMHVEAGCKIQGVFFDQRTLKDRLWSYSSIRNSIKSCAKKLLVAGDGCFRILRRRAPLRGGS